MHRYTKRPGCRRLPVWQSIVSALVACVACPGDTFADELKIRKQDQIRNYRGSLLSIDALRGVMLLDDGTTLEFRLDDVVTLIIASPMRVTTTAGETAIGIFDISRESLHLNSPTFGQTTFARSLLHSAKRMPHGGDDPAVPPPESLALRAKGTSGDTGTQDSAEAKPRTMKSPEAPARQPSGVAPHEFEAEDALLRQEKVSLPRGAIELEGGFSLSHRDASAPLLGPDKTRALTLSGTLRYGITDTTTGYLSVPLSSKYREIQNDIDSTTTERRSGLGDVALGLSHQLRDEDKSGPSVMFGLNLKSHTGKSPYGDIGEKPATGSGHWELTPSVSFVRSLDPAVLFFSVGYTKVFGRAVPKPPEVAATSDFVTATPGNSITIGAGIGISLNEKVAFGLKSIAQHTARSKFNGTQYGASTTSVIVQGTLDYVLDKMSYIEPYIAFGVTKDAPDATFGIAYVRRLGK